MSDVVAVALITGGFTLAGVVATQVFHVLRQRHELEERYRLGLYEKRLAVHQRGFGWLMELWKALKEAIEAGSLAEGKQKVAELCNQADEWWGANSLYLDPQSSKKMHALFLKGRFETDALIRDARRWSKDTQTLPEDSVFKLYADAWSAVQKGIGMKHIDFTVVPED